MRDEKRAFKEWLTSLLPSDLSRNDVAYELGVTRKTISNMLNPDSEGFGNGYTMLRYLRLAGAIYVGAATAPAISRLAALEAKVDQLATANDLERGLDALREAIDALANPGTDQADAGP